jgi:CTP:molybdopterin cytidylyltransferase MocA
MYDSRKVDSYVSPYFGNKGGHPILIPKIIIEKIIHEPDLEINTKEFLSKFKKVCVEVSNDKVLANINTPLEYSQYFY